MKVIHIIIEEERMSYITLRNENGDIYEFEIDAEGELTKFIRNAKLY